MTTPLDPYATGTSALPSATQSIIPATGLGLNGATINTSDLNVSSGGGGVVLGYAGSPGVGNLYFSLSPTSGTDTYGNTVNTGLTCVAGSLTGVSLTGAQMDSTSTLQNTQINQANVLTPTITGGTAASMVQTMTNTGGGVLGYVSSISSVTFATNGNYSGHAPPGSHRPLSNAGVPGAAVVAAEATAGLRRVGSLGVAASTQENPTSACCLALFTRLSSEMAVMGEAPATRGRTAPELYSRMSTAAGPVSWPTQGLRGLTILGWCRRVRFH